MNDVIHFEAHAGLIRKVVDNFARKFGGSWREYWGEAYLHYVHALETWEPEKGSFTKRLTAVVWFKLIHTWESQNQRVLGPTYLSDDYLKDTVPDWRREEKPFCDDVRAVLSLIEDVPSPTRRRVIKALLELGWTGCRIMESFNEIREALS